MQKSSEILGDPDGRVANIVVNDVSKRYAVSRTGAPRTERLQDRIRSRLRSRTNYVNALTSINFVTYPGDTIGIMGHNGSGKSTLLKIISGGELPTHGEVLVNSDPVLLGISAALQPHLTGLQNIRLGCLAMGMSPDEVEEVTDEISDFTELRDALHRPMSTYSSGMSSRLKFAIATANSPDILIVDEALGAGDATFNEKARVRMNKMYDGTGTLFMVSHSPGVVNAHCERAIWLHSGRVIADRSAESVGKEYARWTKSKSAGNDEEAEAIIREAEESYQSPQIVYMN